MRSSALPPFVGVILALLVACDPRDRETDPSSQSAVIGASKLSASDVTVVAPLTTLDAMTPRGGILPDDIAAQIGQLVEHYTADDTLARLRVVCTRFDPCAPQPGGDPAACVGEARIVLQPIIAANGALEAQDAAVHVFFDVDDKRALAARIAALPGANQNGSAPLAVSARLANADYAAAFTAAIREITSSGHLSRVTFLRNTDVKGNAWVFGGFDISPSGVASPLVIPRTGGSEQHVVVNGSGPFVSSLSPAPTGPDTLGMLLDPTRLGILFDVNPSSAKAQIDHGLSAAVALEDPSRHDSATADCASCHLSESARVFGHASAAAHGFEPAAPPRTFTAPETLRACGYVGAKAVISQRTINESAIAAQRMGDLLP